MVGLILANPFEFTELCRMTTFGIEQFKNERFLVRKKSSHRHFEEQKLPQQEDIPTLASISHGIHFILPPGDVKTLPTIPPIRPRTSVERLEKYIVPLRILMHVSSLRGFWCLFVAASVPYRKNFLDFNPRRNPCLQIAQQIVPCYAMLLDKTYTFVVPP